LGKGSTGKPKKRDTDVSMTRQKFVQRNLYVNYVKKAEEFYEEMNSAFQKQHWNVCISNAVLATIAIVDAIAIQQLGQKSSSQNHIEAVFLLNEVKTSDENRKSNIKTEIVDLINMKTPSQYSEKLMSKAEATEAVNKCGKIFSFLKAEIERKVV